MGAGIAASPHCAERRICRSSIGPDPEGRPVSEILAHQLRRRFPSDNSLAKRRPDRLPTAQPEGSLVFQPIGAWPKPKPSDVPRPFLGRSLLRPALLFRPKASEPRRARGRSTLPAPLPDWPRNPSEELSHCLSAEIGPSVTLRSLLALAGLPVEAGTSVPITFDNARRLRVGEAKNTVTSLWITGISGTTVGTHCNSASCRLRLPIRSVASARIALELRHLSRAAPSSQFAPRPGSAPAARSSPGSSSVAICTSIWPGKICLVRVEQRRPALRAEVPPPMLRRGIFLGLALDLQIVLLHQPPGDHRRARVPPAVAAMAQRLVHRVRRHFVASPHRNGIDPSAFLVPFCSGSSICHNRSEFGQRRSLPFRRPCPTS